MKKINLIIVLVCAFQSLWGQRYDLEALEQAFLKNNLRVIAEHYEIDKAAALIVQEKVWPNPSLTLDNVNLWSNSTIELVPPLFGNFGRKQQFAFEFEQLLETAGKRSKRVAVRESEMQLSKIAFENLLREFKSDLRKNYQQLLLLEKQKQIMEASLSSFQGLKELYQKQSEKQNISVASFYRVESEWIAIQKEVLELRKTEDEYLHQIRLITQLPDLEIQQLAGKGFALHGFPKTESILFQKAKEHNGQLRLQTQLQQKAEQLLSLEKANKVPDLSVLANYERGGNLMQNFVGIGVKMDLPIFNRNKGNIEAAKIELEQTHKLKEAQESELDNQISKLHRELVRLEDAIRQHATEDADLGLLLMEKYNKQLAEKQITLLEFLDFAQAYRSAQSAILELQTEYISNYEDLQFLVGQEI